MARATSLCGVYWTLSKEDEVEFNHPMEYFSYIKAKYKVHSDQIEELIVARVKITTIDELLYSSLNPSLQDPISFKTNKSNIDYFQKIVNESGDTWGYVFLQKRLGKPILSKKTIHHHLTRRISL